MTQPANRRLILAGCWCATLVAAACLMAAVWGRVWPTKEVVYQWSAAPISNQASSAPAAGDGSTELISGATSFVPNHGEALNNTAHQQAAALTQARWSRFLNSRRSEQLGDGRGVIPPEERWQLEFASGLTEGPYARQLDALKIELAVIADDGTLQYGTALAQAEPVQRSGSMTDEPRLYLTWDRGDLIQADRALLAKAGIDASRRIVLHFFSSETTEQLKQLEAEFAELKENQIRLTRFGIRRTFRGYQLYVIDQVKR